MKKYEVFYRTEHCGPQEVIELGSEAECFALIKALLQILPCRCCAPVVKDATGRTIAWYDYELARYIWVVGE